MTQSGAATVLKQVVVDAPIDRAFTVFTTRFGDFKPPEHNLLGAPIAETVFEARVGEGEHAGVRHQIRIQEAERARRERLRERGATGWPPPPGQRRQRNARSRASTALTQLIG